MSLSDDLSAYPSADEQKYTPRTEFDGVSGYIQTGPLREVPQDFTELLEQFEYDPAKVAITGHPKVSKWQQRSRNQETGEYETVWLSSYKFSITPIGTSVADLEAVILNAKDKPTPGTGAFWFVFQAGDQQIGKRSRDGDTEQIIERYVESVDRAKQEFNDLKRLGIEGIQISLPGDCIEGGVSQGGKNLWLTKETVTEQTRILRRLMMHTVEELAPLVDRVYLDVVNGNHDEQTRQLNFYPGDGWATETAIALSDALTLNKTAYGHVEVRVPNKWRGNMTVPVGDTTVTVVHGHQWRKGQAWRWWADQAVNNQPAGAAQILQSGHYHEWAVSSSESKVHIQSSTYDMGSDWFVDKTGATAKRGGLVYLLNAGEVSRMSIV